MKQRQEAVLGFRVGGDANSLSHTTHSSLAQVALIRSD